ncbi:hypothetical protein BBK36DRAFT_1144126 [Trichoderma citrinoviride]|uniref:DUF7896 domain-containing protein n=1 Tax=Trichoderma citrinoviride TaxID=58853 RepID=A0A2T4B162_9HYPO|nr:hypothetical protein BBK36DRAFT_1144126 [Trichoderma citrinoviride]PTB63062.1 hypothetical protein BBK36DRAFT_1144126 [Trichoderma citrinoviride]
MEGFTIQNVHFSSMALAPLAALVGGENSFLAAPVMGPTAALPTPAETPSPDRPVRRPRPAGPRVFCQLCDEYPSGFRGKHELSRHTSLKHGNQVQVFACLDPGATATVKGHPIRKPFAECKHCMDVKFYNSEQNAIDHLRRGHFIPKYDPHSTNNVRVLPRDLPAAEMRRWVEKMVITLPPPTAGPAPVPAPAPGNDNFIPGQGFINPALLMRNPNEDD